MPLDLVATLSELVAIPSVNPMGRAAVGAEFFEHRLTDYLQQLLGRFQIPTFRQTIAPLRENLLARIDGDVAPEAGGELLLFEAHQDTVGVEGMTVDPWTPTIHDGRLYGRGSCDVKGSRSRRSSHGRFGLHRQRRTWFQRRRRPLSALVGAIVRTIGCFSTSAPRRCDHRRADGA
jgi:hypothetical protein